MFRKGSVILLLLIYAISSSGMSIRQFYCCGKLKSVSLVIDNFPKQDCDKGDGNDGCCKNKFQYFKIKDTHLASSELIAPYLLHLDLAVPLDDFLAKIVALQNEIALNSGPSPPATTTVPIYLSNCVFRI
jgi:hypothetical protein